MIDADDDVHEPEGTGILESLNQEPPPNWPFQRESARPPRKKADPELVAKFRDELKRYWESGGLFLAAKSQRPAGVGPGSSTFQMANQDQDWYVHAGLTGDSDRTHIYVDVSAKFHNLDEPYMLQLTPEAAHSLAVKLMDKVMEYWATEAGE